MLDANYFQFGPFFFVFFSDNVAVIRCITCGEMRKEHLSSSPSIFLNSSVCLLLSKNIQRNYKMTDILKNVEDKFTEPSLWISFMEFFRTQVPELAGCHEK